MTEFKPSFGRRLRTLFVGAARKPTHPEVFKKLSLAAFLAWVGLGADGLSSSCYGPPEAYIALGAHAHLGIFVALMTAITIFVISQSYSQIIELFPSGGGGYLVASKLLTPQLGMVAGCALLVDYMLTITISIASGWDQLLSILPPAYQVYKLPASMATLAAMTLMNLRGVKESVKPLVPIFLTFVVLHVIAILYAIVTRGGNLGAQFSQTASDVRSYSSTGVWGTLAMVFIVMHAYSMGAGTFTGIEAVSNGLPILREPRVRTAKRAMTYMWVSLAFMVVGLMLSYLLFAVQPKEGKTINAVLLESVSANWPAWMGVTFVVVALASEGALLFVAAQSGFIDGPRVISYMALDRWFPSRLSLLSDRLVVQNGVLMMAVAAFITMWSTDGKVEYLVVLYSINVFITFLLSQSGMVRHWLQVARKGGQVLVEGASAALSRRQWVKGLLINGAGVVLTALILVWVTVSKFLEGGWVTLVLTGSLIVVVSFIRRYYKSIGPKTARLNKLTDMAQAAGEALDKIPAAKQPQFNPQAKTAVLLVTGFNGFGMHTLLNIIRFFGDSFRNFVFVQVGVVDAGNFKGTDEVQHLQRHVQEQTQQYVNFVRAHGYFGEAFTRISTDVVDELETAAPELVKKYPDAVFFAGQLVFPQENLLTRLLHNNITFALQRRLYRLGIPFVILPIRV